MCAERNLYELEMARFEVFKSQDHKNEEFDVVFEVSGKKLYANKFILTPISPTFKAMLSDLWKKPDQSVKIAEYSCDDFKEFLTFIYSGECQLTNENIFLMTDIAEFYGVHVFKAYCEKYLSGMLNLENIYPMLELADKYSMVQLKQDTSAFIAENFPSFLQSEQFYNLPKPIVVHVVKSNQQTPIQKKLFEFVYKWAEIRALELQKGDNSLDLNEAIKNELADILPFINFELMTYSSIVKFVVKVIDNNGKTMKGHLECPESENVVNYIKTLKNVDSTFYDGVFFGCYWIGSGEERPSKPSELMEDESVEWYLIYDSNGENCDIAIKHRQELLDGNYLLAEMFAEDGFILNNRCKIEVV